MYWPAVVDPTLPAGVVVVPLGAPCGVCRAGGTGSNTALKLRRDMGEVLRGGEEKEGYSTTHSRRNADLVTVHNHIDRLCPQNLSVQSTGGATGTEEGPSPAHGVSAASDIPFPCSFCQDLPPQGLEWLWRAHTFSTPFPAPSGILHLFPSSLGNSPPLSQLL